MDRTSRTSKIYAGVASVFFVTAHACATCPSRDVTSEAIAIDQAKCALKQVSELCTGPYSWVAHKRVNTWVATSHSSDDRCKIWSVVLSVDGGRVIKITPATKLPATEGSKASEAQQ